MPLPRLCTNFISRATVCSSASSSTNNRDTTGLNGIQGKIDRGPVTTHNISTFVDGERYFRGLRMPRVDASNHRAFDSESLNDIVIIWVTDFPRLAVALVNVCFFFNVFYVIFSMEQNLNDSSWKAGDPFG